MELVEPELIYKFWANLKHTWYYEPEGYVFLPNVLQAVGSALAGTEWTGREAAERILPVLDDLPFQDHWKMAFAAQMVNEFLEKHGQVPDPFRDVSARPLTNREKRLAKDFYQNHHARRLRESRQRFNAAARCILTAAADGRLETAVRPVEGGNPFSVPPEHWRSERALRRFDLCLMDPEDPFSGKPVSIDAHAIAKAEFSEPRDEYFKHGWIFVSKSSLQLLLEELQSKPQRGRPSKARPKNVAAKKVEALRDKLIEDWKRGRGHIITRQQFEELCRSQFNASSTLSRRIFSDRPDEWKKPGPRGKRNPRSALRASPHLLFSAPSRFRPQNRGCASRSNLAQGANSQRLQLPANRPQCELRTSFRRDQIRKILICGIWLRNSIPGCSSVRPDADRRHTRIPNVKDRRFCSSQAQHARRRHLHQCLGLHAEQDAPPWRRPEVHQARPPRHLRSG